ncbi:MAG: ATP-binding cassette domain-containing protein [Bosea sp. (in: a-proteobacteria)]
MLELDALTVSYPDFTGRYSLIVPKGALCTVIGPSGGGKTTMLHAVAGFEPVTSGHLRYSGMNMQGLTPAARPCSLLFQDHNLFPHLNAEQNVALGIKPNLSLDRLDRDMVAEALAAVDLTDEAKRLPGELSGGQRQRVALARALVMRRPLLLLDEPFGALDPGLRKSMIRLTDKLRQRHGLTVLMTIHTPADIAAVADLVAFVANGKVQDVGSPREMLRAGRSAALDAFMGI